MLLFLRSPKPNYKTQYFSTNSKLGFLSKSIKPTKETTQLAPKLDGSHPWAELMECLSIKGYLQESGELVGKDSNRIRSASLNFARDRVDLIRYFSRKDIEVVVGSGCPSIDRKVVNSGKRLRAHVGIEEGNVCSSCGMRGDCDRAYVRACDDEAGRTVDVMRVILTYGLEPLTGFLENKSSLNKNVKESVRRLLKQMVEFSLNEPNLEMTTKPYLQEDSISQEGNNTCESMKQGDWICPKCNFLNFARNIKCLRCNGLFQERLRKLGEDQDHLPLKKGDWLCDKCNFLNFAKNTRCLQCKEKPPKRLLNPGEWECDSCNYVNFRRNTVCLKCDHRRPKASNYSGPHDENGGIHQPSYDRTERNRPSSERRQERKIQSKGGGNIWRFVEDESRDRGGLISSNEVSGFVDFPIVRGKSISSQNAGKIEKWKFEMLKTSRSAPRTEKNEDEFRHVGFQKEVKFIESTGGDDDDEMSEWFGHRKKLETD